eukprot:2604325-Karenia_brevis.AAC.1
MPPGSYQFHPLLQRVKCPSFSINFGQGPVHCARLSASVSRCGFAREQPAAQLRNSESCLQQAWIATPHSKLRTRKTA